MKKKILKCAVCALLTANVCLSAFAMPQTQAQDDDIVYVTEETETIDDIQTVTEDRLDENGQINVEVRFPDDAVFPYSITMTGSEGEVSFTIDYNRQRLLIKPGTYEIKSARDGNNKKMPAGASLDITENTDAIELDFTSGKGREQFSLPGFISANIGFVILAGAAFGGLKKYCAYNGIGRSRS